MKRTLGEADDEAFVQLSGISKRFGAVPALAGVDLAIAAGRMVGVVGHNGAGKSTLMQILAGTLAPDAGTIHIAGHEVGQGYGVRRAHALGIRCVFQELSLCANLSAEENVRVIHPHLAGPGWRRRARRLIGDALAAIFPGHGIDTRRPICELPLGQRQMIETARAFTETDHAAQLVILDEPTASLDATATDQLLRYVVQMRARGIAVVFISHRLSEILGHADEIVVMRDGQVAGRVAAGKLDEAQLVEMMGRVRRAEPAHAPGWQGARGTLRVEQPVCLGSDFPVRLRAGEVVGLAGLDGHGQRTLLQAVFEAAGHRRAALRVSGSVAYVSGDRRAEGLFPLWSVGLNITVGNLSRLASLGFLNPARERAEAEEWRAQLDIRTPDIDRPIMSLSGGNQQKTLVARAFAAEADIVLFDDPLRGVDVGTKRELYQHVRRAADWGHAFLWYTTESAELVNCDRVYVFYRGTIVDEIDGAKLTEERVIRASFGGGRALPADLSTETTAATRHHGARLASAFRVGLPAVALVAILSVIFAMQPRAMSYSGLTILLNFALPAIFVAMAQMAVIAAGDIDLGIGAFVSLVNCIAATLLARSSLLGWFALAALVAAYAAMGTLIHVRRLPSIVITLGASFVWLGLALLVLPGPGGAPPSWLPALLAWQPPLLPLPVLASILLAGLGEFLLMHTSYGVVLRGIGSNPRAIARAGWSLLAGRAALYAFAGACGVTAGLSLTGLNTAGDATVGTQYTLISIAAVIVGGGEFVGGIATPIGTVVGAWIMLLTGSLLSFLNISTDWQLSVQGGILILVLGLRALNRRSTA
ncbi:ATP-binding cassette domain-containing protein [Paraburkholderia sp. BL9I2N2]|uniref:ATP-binding cassette domain-containing protein n=1 Tax=Paraburkholderia sp. BL9I2N2 TaxID=1938809 RepID=UPI0010EEAB2A|nr:ATP-binding cassette domain-containing protein [Paraburkholderia sp. BL9I2N2]TCK84332.1 ribose transport system ATP-binding protein [Paraburkholderia sp. BL9I2N2]